MRISTLNPSELSDPSEMPPCGGGGKTGSICHFAFSLVLQCLGVPRYPDAAKNSTKSVIVTPLVGYPKSW